MARRCSWLGALILGACFLPLGHSEEKTGAGAAEPAPRQHRAKPGGPPVDNGRCFVCHLNYAEEQFAVAHAKGGYGCVKCHGESDDHCGDENHLTAPDIMYHWRKVGRSCIACHEPAEVLEIEKHKPDLLAIALEDKICTDCHSQHRLPRRNRRWDRETGELLPLPPPKDVVAISR